jgi:hypothetical protein
MARSAPAIAAVAAFLMMTSACLAGRTYRVRQGGSEWTVQAYTTSETLEDFYGYHASGEDYTYFRGGDRDGVDDALIGVSDLAGGQSHLFLVESTADARVGIFAVHNTYNNAGRSGSAEMLFSADGGLSLNAWDDGDGTYGDEYGPDALGATGTQVAAQWRWGAGYTDGLAVGWTPSPGDSATVSFTDIDSLAIDPSGADYSGTPSGLDAWNLYDAGSSNAHQPIPIAAAVSEGLSATITLVPLPAAAWPAMTLLALIGADRFRRRRRDRVQA